MSKQDFYDLMHFARSNNLMNVPLDIVVTKYQEMKGSVI